MRFLFRNFQIATIFLNLPLKNKFIQLRKYRQKELYLNIKTFLEMILGLSSKYNRI